MQNNGLKMTQKNMIYLDYNASAPLHKEAHAAMLAIYESNRGAYNASAVHGYGRAGRKIVEDARIQVASMIGAPPAQVIFNSGATEGNNTILHHFSTSFPDESIYVCSTDHPSVVEATDTLRNIKTIPVNENGLVQPDILDALLTENKTSLVSIMLVNNETGSIQDVSELSSIVHRHGALFHCDATQAAGRIPIDITSMGIDFSTLSAHKIGGPQGVGALALGLCGQTPTLLFGGGQEKSARAGTENVAGIAGFGAAAAQSNIETYENLARLRSTLEQRLKEISPDVVIHCENIPRVANTTFFSLPNADSQSLLMALDLENIAVSNGSACSSGSVKPSHVLKAMGCPENIAASALRISTGWATTKDDIDAFLAAWDKIYKRIKR